MEIYKYSAKSLDGAKVNGVIEAFDEYEAVEHIRSRYPIIIGIRKIEKKESILNKEIGKSYNARGLALMCSRFSTILNSGIDISSGIEIIADQTEDKKLKKMLIKSAEDVSAGNGIAESFNKNFKGLPVSFTETIKAGELSGNLANSFKTLEKYYKRSYKLKEKIREAMIYPIFVIIVAILVLGIVMTKVMPVISGIFDDFGGELPAITVFLINASWFFNKFWPLLLMILLVAILLIHIYHRSEKGKYSWSRRIFKVPVIGSIIYYQVCANFALTMSSLMLAGLTITDALSVTAAVIDNEYFKREILKVKEKIEIGYSFGKAMSQSNAFPSTLTEMAAIGEESGEIENTLNDVSAFYTDESDFRIGRAIARLEPMLLVFLAIFAGFIVISIYLPMFQMYQLM